MRCRSGLKEDKLESIPVAVLTSSGEEKDRVTGYKLGVDGYGVKRIDFDEFVNAIEELGIFRALINEPPPGSLRKGREALKSEYAKQP